MKKKLIIPILLFLDLLITAQDVKIGVFVHAPHVYANENTNEVYGPGIDYISEVVKAMGYRPVIHLLPLPRIFAYLQTGKIDISLELIKTDEREKYLFYSETPSYVMVPSLTFLSTRKIKEIKTIDDLENMKIGYLKGAAYAPFFMGSATVTFDYVSGDNWIQQNLGKLLAGRIDAALDNNAYSYIEEAKNQGVERKIKTLLIPGEGTNYYVVFSKLSPKGSELLKKYNEAIATGKYNEQAMIDKFMHK